MKKVWKRALACMLVLTMVAGYLPAKMNSVVNAEDSKAPLEFGKSDTYLQLSNPLSAAPQAIEATVNMPTIKKEWVLCAAKDIAFEKGTAADSVQTTDGTETVEPVAGTSYAQVQLTNAQELLFSKKFDVTIPYTYSNDDVALSFWVYSDTAVVIDAGFIELTSSGTNDHNERCWGFSSNYSGNLTLKTGWNYVELPVSKMIKGCTDADFNLQEANYIRWHSTRFSSITDDSTITIGLTDMKLVVIADRDADLQDTLGTLLVSSEETNMGTLAVPGTATVTNGGKTYSINYKEAPTGGADARVDFNTQSTPSAVENVVLTKSDLSKYNLEFWMKSSADMTINLNSVTFKLIGGTTGDDFNNNALQLKGTTISLEADKWTKVSLSLTAEGNENKLKDDFNGFKWVRFLMTNITEGTKIAISDMKLVDTDYADGEWTIAEIGDTDISASDVANAENGPGTGTKIYAMNIPTVSGLEKTLISSIPKSYQLVANAETKKLTGDDIDNLKLDFWLYAPNGNFKAWLRLYEGDNEILRFGLHEVTMEKGWNHIQIPLSKAIYDVQSDDKNDFSKLNRVTIAKHGNAEAGTYYIGDIKIVDTAILKSLDYADGEWTITQIGNTESTGTNAPQGSKVVEKDVKKSTNIIEENVSCQLPSYYNLEVTESSKPISGDDVDNLMLDFWVCIPSEYSAKNLGFWLYMYYGATNDTTRLDLNLGNNTSVTAGWNHIQVPMSAFNSGSDTVNASKITDITKVKFVSFGSVVEGKYFFSDIKIIDTNIYTPIEESTYDATALNYMIFSNLNATSETNQSALFVTKTGNPAFVWGSKQYTLNQNVCTGENVKIKVVRFASGNIQFYINDEPVGMSATKTAALNAPTTAHCIGGDAAGKQIMNGSISNLKVYSDATLSTCIGNWALRGNIQNVTGTMSDSSANANTAVFRGSRADDWSDYIVPTEVEGAVDTLVTSSGLSYDGSATEVSMAYVKQGAKTVAVNYRKVTARADSSAFRVDFNSKALEQIDLSTYNLEDLAIEFWLKCSNKDVTTLPGGLLRVGTDSAKYGEAPYLGYDCADISLTASEWTKVTLSLKDATNVGNVSNTDKFAWIRFLITGLSEGDDVFVSDIKIVKAEQQPWSLVYIPDMENLTSNETYNATWKAMAQWIADNAETENIQHVIGGGDTTTDNSSDAYARAKEGYQLFMNNVSWSTMVGLNDYAEGYDKRDASNYQATFGEAVIKASAASDTYKGSYVDSEKKSTTENSYYRFSVNGVKWMILQLEYNPRNEVLTWADGIVKEYPLDNVILTTQGYLNGYGSKLSMGTTTWNALSVNQNIKMILCGYSTNGTGAIVQATETYSDGTGSVPVLMMNAQDLDAGADAYYTDRPLGMISILRFSADGTKVAVQYYSPTEGKSFSPEDNYGNANSNNLILDIDTEVCTPIVTPYGENYGTTFKAAVAPTVVPDGYIFAGWFTDEACMTALKASDNDVTIAYAKFVDEEILSVKAQVRLDKVTDDEGKVIGYKLPEDMTDMRFVTTVDSTKYKKVGFEITANDKDGNPKTIKVGSEFVYEYLYAVGKVGTEGAEPMSYTPSGACSPQSTLFKTFTVTDIPVRKYGETFTVRAYWITQDGTTVYGDSSVKTVEAGEP